MKKLLSFFCVTMILAACGGAPTTKNPVDGDLVSVHYVGTRDDGSEFDSSRKPGKTPFEFAIGSGQTIPGFEKAVRELSVGEKKKFRIEPKDAYGEEYITRTLPLSQFKSSQTEEVDTGLLLGVMEQKITKANLIQMIGSEEIGTEKTIGNTKIKLLSIQGEEATLAIEDSNAPFYGKKLEAGMTKTVKDGTLLTIKSIKESEKKVTVEIAPKYEIISKTDKDVTFKIKNNNPLAGQALNFEIELLSIKPATPAAPAPAPTPTK